MKTFTRMCLSLFAVCMAGGLFANHLTGSLLFTARFSGANEVPAIETDATGVGGFFINAAKDSLCITISVNGLSGPITGAHIHEGMAGENGPVLVNFTSDVMGNTIMATVTGEDLTMDLIVAMLRGELYFNIHTEENPGGEIRGQIELEKDQMFYAMADPDQETGDVMSEGTGLARFNLSKTGMMVDYYIVVDGLTGPIMGAHIHTGAMGEDGPVTVNLTDGIDGNVISGSFNPMEFTGLLENMMDGDTYLNVHTDEYMAGEIRGQIMMDMTIAHDAILNIAQEMPEPMGADGNGLALVRLNYTMDTLFYDVQAEGMTGEITGAHFHDGALGMNGDVLINLTDDIMDNQISGFVTGAALTNENINKFLSGMIYINLHTEMNMPGEIRGQVYKLAREGYTYELEGEQQVPMLDIDAYGSGIVSIDRNQGNVHFMFAYSDLTGPATMAHFHMAEPGVNGDVIFDLSPYLNLDNTYDAAFGYWTSEDDMPFTADDAAAFRNGMVYVNVHTSMNPGGEPRGQVTRGLICSDMTVGILDTPERQNLSVYPNPTVDQVNIDLSGLPSGNAVFRMMDITGKTIHEFAINPDAQSNLRLDVSNLVSGIYMISISGENVNYSARLVRE